MSIIVIISNNEKNRVLKLILKFHVLYLTNLIRLMTACWTFWGIGLFPYKNFYKFICQVSLQNNFSKFINSVFWSYLCKIDFLKKINAFKHWIMTLGSFFRKSLKMSISKYVTLACVLSLTSVPIIWRFVY